MNAEKLLARLHGVKATGRGRWLARSPAHDDKSPSLSVRELEDATVLINDFGGCSVREIVAEVGLELSDLFPPRPASHRHKPERRPFHAEDVLRAVASEARLPQSSQRVSPTDTTSIGARSSACCWLRSASPTRR